MDDLRYLKLLRRQYPTLREASVEVTRLRAMLKLPKGTEHFLSDLHGEHGAFLHMLHNASGVIKEKIKNLYEHQLTKHERDLLCTLIYYPEEKLSLLKAQGALSDEWYCITIHRLVEVCRLVSIKYTRRRVRQAMSAAEDISPLIEELLLPDIATGKQEYFHEMLSSIVSTGQGDVLIAALAHIIQHLAIDRLHILGDIFDRGDGADLILDALETYHHVDVQWGNHDIAWMGAAALSEACIAQVIVTTLKYGNLDTLEVGYGISLRPLASLAGVYAKDPCDAFLPRENGGSLPGNKRDLARMHKAAAVLLFKLEGQLLSRHPEYGMKSRRLLHRIHYKKGTIKLGGTTYPLRTCCFPTIDPEDPYTLTPLESDVLARLVTAFAHSQRLQRHIAFLFKAGGMYLRCNGNLLYHGCIPMTKEGEFAPLPLPGNPTGRAAIDAAERLARQGYFAREDSAARLEGQDFLWYLSCGPNSPLFGKDRMTTFERYFIDDPATHVECKNPYYDFMGDEAIAHKILKEFDLLPDTGYIINGHVPVKLGAGESPVRAGGRLFVIDGGLSHAYQPVTGIAGYTLIFNSNDLTLVAHQPFKSKESAITDEQDIRSVLQIVAKMPRRLHIEDTDEGCRLHAQIADLEMLITAYRNGTITEGLRAQVEH